MILGKGARQTSSLSFLLIICKRIKARMRRIPLPEDQALSSKLF
jgi:hypothetical protein